MVVSCYRESIDLGLLPTLYKLFSISYHRNAYIAYLERPRLAGGQGVEGEVGRLEELAIAARV
jgi:hypothetical protein